MVIYSFLFALKFSKIEKESVQFLARCLSIKKKLLPKQMIQNVIKTFKLIFLSHKISHLNVVPEKTHLVSSYIFVYFIFNTCNV